LIPRDEAEAFWTVTTDCLIEFHGLSRVDAEHGVKALRASLADVRVAGAEEMIYHDEPFHVACDIAGRDLDRFAPEIATEYQRMLEGPFPVFAVALPVGDQRTEQGVER
jgi:hypothetical protein